MADQTMIKMTETAMVEITSRTTTLQQMVVTQLGATTKTMTMRRKVP